MELVAGETLAERIAKGRIPVDEAIPIFIQIAEGLEAAHEKSIIHRDLKPANIKIGPDGKPKILDFGLAKAFVGPEASAPISSQSPTLTKGTALGAILGTPAYMSPEQARGKTVDKRADVWAFGCCLYEALTGASAFHRETTSDTLAHVLQNEPDWTKLAEATPRKVKELVRRCLRKDSKRRLHDIADARIELEEALTTSMSTSTADNAEAAPTPQRPAWRTVLPWMVGAAVGSLVTGIAVWSLRSPAPPRLTRFTVAPPAAEGIALATQSHDIAISPDGTHVVFKAAGARTRRFYVRAMSRLSATPLEGLGPQAFSPFISPDSTWVGFHDEDDDTLKKVSVVGGPVVSICRTQGLIFGTSWGADDIIVFGTEGGGGP